MSSELESAGDGFWLFDGLEEEPYGILPLINLSGKNNATSTKYVDRIGSYQWDLSKDEPIPGTPQESIFWPGGRLVPDRGVLVYDVNHLKIKNGTLDSLILAAKHLSEKKKKSINFNDYDFITDSINLQKLFAFAQEAGEGLFRIDCERVGKTVLLSRIEASDLMEIGHLTFDQSLKEKITKPHYKHCTGPFFQLVSYQYGSYKMLVRYEVDSADFSAFRSVTNQNNNPVELPQSKKFNESDKLKYIEFGEVPKNVPLQLITTYPQNSGFPYFTWAQMFYTAADQEIVGFFKNNGDFGKSSIYSFNDISKFLKPLPIVVLSKVHDCLHKIRLFLLKNDENFRFGLIWKGKNHLEIFAKHTNADGAVSSKVRQFLATQCEEYKNKED